MVLGIFCEEYLQCWHRKAKNKSTPQSCALTLLIAEVQEFDAGPAPKQLMIDSGQMFG
jgi:hypothetical protein